MVTDTTRQEAGARADFDFDAGWLCLDFANTIPVHATSQSERQAHPDEHRGLERYEDFVEWARQAGQLDELTVARLLGNAADHPDRADVALRRALQLREVIYRLVVAGANGSPPGPGDLREFNAALRAARARLEVGQAGGEFVWAWKDLGAGLDAPLGVVLESAAQLLTSPGDLTRVGHCAGETCDWLFIDTSRNRSRRWCSMSGCGNRAKARRHHQRKRAAV